MRRLIVSLLSIVLLTGCWSSEELNNQAFVSVIIIDKKEDGIEVTLGIPLTTNMAVGDTGSQSSGDQPFGYFSRTADTIENALQKVQGDLSRKANFGQNRHIILGRAFAESGIMPLIEFSSNNPFLRLNTNIFLVDGYAKDEVSKATVVSERFIVTILNKYIEQRVSMQTTIRDLVISKTSGGDALLPILKFAEISEGASVGVASTIGTGGAAILRRGKLVEPILTPLQTSAAKSILNQLGQYYFSIDSPTDEKPVGLYSTIVNSNRKVEKRGEDVYLIIKPVSEVMLLSNNSNIDFSRTDHAVMMKEQIEAYINGEISKTMSIIQQTGADVFHFDRYLDVRYPKEFQEIKENWRGYYRDHLKLDIQSEVNLRRKGSVMKSFGSVIESEFDTDNSDNGEKGVNSDNSDN